MMDHDLTHFQVLNNFAALPVEGHEEEWKQLMARFNLKVGYIASVRLILANGSWRNANDPVAYIGSAARSEKRKLDRLQQPRGRERCIAEQSLPCEEDGSPMDHDEGIDLLNKKPMDSESNERYAMSRVKAKFLIADSLDEDAECTVDYSKLMDEVARVAGLSKSRRDWIEELLILRATAPISRAQILRHPDVGARKPLQAAWRWLAQHNALLVEILSRPADPRVGSKSRTSLSMQER